MTSRTPFYTPYELLSTTFPRLYGFTMPTGVPLGPRHLSTAATSAGVYKPPTELEETYPNALYQVTIATSARIDDHEVQMRIYKEAASAVVSLLFKPYFTLLTSSKVKMAPHVELVASNDNLARLPFNLRSAFKRFWGKRTGAYPKSLRDLQEFCEAISKIQQRRTNDRAVAAQAAQDNIRAVRDEAADNREVKRVRSSLNPGSI